MKYFVCRHVSIWGFQNRVCLSVCTPSEEVTIASCISNWYINGKVFTSSYYSMETQKFEKFTKEVWNSNFDLWRRHAPIWWHRGCMHCRGCICYLGNEVHELYFSTQMSCMPCISSSKWVVCLVFHQPNELYSLYFIS